MTSIEAWWFALARLPRAPRRVPHWSAAIRSALDLAELVNLLNRGSAIMLVTLMVGPIVLSYEAPARVAGAIEALGAETRPMMWRWVALHADELWGPQAPMRAAALARHHDAPGSIALLTVAPLDVLADPEIRKRIRHAAMSSAAGAERASRVTDARAAAVLLSRLSDDESLADAKRALADWTAHPVTDQTRRMPDSPLDILGAYIAERDPDDETLRALAAHDHQAVRSAAIKVLERRPFDRTLWDGLLGTAGEADIIIAAALNRTPTRERFAWVLSLVDSPSTTTREHIAAALAGTTSQPEVDAALARLVRDPDPQVRDRAFQAARAIGARSNMGPPTQPDSAEGVELTSRRSSHRRAGPPEGGGTAR